MRSLPLALFGVAPLCLLAQAAPEIGRLPLLADLRPGGGACKVVDVNAALRRADY